MHKTHDLKAPVGVEPSTFEDEAFDVAMEVFDSLIELFGVDEFSLTSLWLEPKKHLRYKIPVGF